MKVKCERKKRKRKGDLFLPCYCWFLFLNFKGLIFGGRMLKCCENANVCFSSFQNQTFFFCTHLITAGCNNYLTHLRTWRGERCLWLWGELLMGFWTIFWSSINEWHLGDRFRTAHHSPTPPPSLPTLRRRTFPRAIKAREVQSDDREGCNRECD